jgi:hypothetical protein
LAQRLFRPLPIARATPTQIAPHFTLKKTATRGEGEKGAFVKSVLVEWGEKVCAQCMLSLWLIILRNLLLAKTKGVKSRQQQHSVRLMSSYCFLMARN